MATIASAGNSIADAGSAELELGLTHPVSINISPIIESMAGKLTDDEIDQWFVDMESTNEGRGFYLELTGEGELIFNSMVNMDAAFAEAESITDLTIWARDHGGRVPSSRGIVRLPDGSRVEPDMAWLSPEQLAILMPITPRRAITICPVFVAEIMSGTDRMPLLQRKMERYIANGAQLGWLIDPMARQVHIYRPETDVEILHDPESVSGEPVLPGFVFQVRERIFALHDSGEAS